MFSVSSEGSYPLDPFGSPTRWLRRNSSRAYFFSMQPSLHFDAERQASRRRIEDLHPADRFKLMFGHRTLAELEAEVAKENEDPTKENFESMAKLVNAA